jgi:Vault protein inter-alpha-trypsin domain
MRNWTTQSEQRLAEYLQERVAREGFNGEDASELKDDLRRHIYEEAEKSEGEVIGLMHLENILARLDAGYRPIGNRVAAVPASQKQGGFLKWTCGVVLPLGVLIFELLATFCGSVFFSPVPTWWHAGWIALVPLLNAWLLLGKGTESVRGAAAGFTLVTALFYGLLFLPMIHLSVIGLIFFGLGVVSLTPILAAIVSWRIGVSARTNSLEPQRFKVAWRLGVLASVVVLVSLEGPAVWTRINLSAAMKGDQGSAAALSRLRAFHSERTLLKGCYEGNRGMSMATDISGWLSSTWGSPLSMFGFEGVSPLNSEKARDVFFRVTGKPFNSLKPPSGAVGTWTGRGDTFQEFEFDEHLGGDEVAVRLKNLDLSESRFDGHVNATSRIGYGEWTMVFKNSSSQVKEARCQVKLPAGGRVSRLTLWVNGEPREAAFNSISKVKAAYKAVAVVQRRDPVLVNVVGPDTIMVQCFPVPAHGQMKIRFGVSAPLENGRWEIPHVVERNFGLAENLENAIWLQGDCEFNLTSPGKSQSAIKDGPGRSLSASFQSGGLMSPGTALCTESLPAAAPVVWCEDQFAKPEERFLVREPTTLPCPAASQVVVIIDGSAAVAQAKEWIVRSIGSQNGGELVLVLADDYACRVTYTFSGGRDNEPALREGIRLARESGGPIVWIHGPQAVGLSQSEALLQQLERGTTHPLIYEVAAVAGPNRLAEAIYRTGCIKRGPLLLSPERDFTGFLKQLLTDHQQNAWTWKRSATLDNIPGTKVWDHLARLWAASTAEDTNSSLADAGRADLASRYQLVTLFSGAVVLETRQQYAEHGLTPVDGSATPQMPNVPEPSTSLLVMLATVAAMMRRKRIIQSEMP